MRYARLGLIAGLAALAACGQDPVAPPPAPEIKHGIKAERDNELLYPDVNFTWNSGDEVPIPTFTYTDFKSYCYAQLRIANNVVVVRQAQILRWDDENHYTIIGIPRRELVRGEVEIQFQWWRGTYAGQRVECVYLNHITLYSTTYEYTFKVGDAQGRWNRIFWACQGDYNCDTYDPATIDISLFFDFRRNCNIDRPQDLWTVQYLPLGGTPNILQYPPLGHTWTYRLYAFKPGYGQWSNGWWTVLDYGGNSNQGYGFPSGRDVCALYYDLTTAGALGQQAGHASWILLG